MNILMLLQSDFPPDIRLSKEIRSLTESGHKVFLLCNNNNNKPQTEVVEGAMVIRLNHYSLLPTKAAKLIRLPVFFNLVWLIKTIQTIYKYKINVIHAHDLPMAPIGIIIGKLLVKPVVYDMHENYPAVMKEWYKPNLFYFLFKNPKFAQILDAFCIKFSNRLITVIDERKELLVKNGSNPSNIFIVSNTIDLNDYNKHPIVDSITQKYTDYKVLLYIGFFCAERGIETAIIGTKLLIKSIPNIKLLLIGKGEDKPKLEQLISKNELNNHVEIIDWVDFKYIPSYTQAAQICLDPRPSNPANDTTISHKIFQFMASQKPIVASDAKPFRRILNECKCGTTFKSNDASSFAEAVQYIFNSKENFGENGKKAVKEQYNWQNSSKELIRLYNTI